MSEKRKDYKLYLFDIKSSCLKIIRYTKNKTNVQFANNQILIDAVARNIEIIGEAGNKIHPKLRKSLPEVNWGQIIGMRNKLIHDYFDLNIDIIWKTVTDDIPILKRQINKVLKNLGSSQLRIKI